METENMQEVHEENTEDIDIVDNDEELLMCSIVKTVNERMFEELYWKFPYKMYTN